MQEERRVLNHLITQSHVRQYERVLHGAGKDRHDLVVTAHQLLKLWLILDIANTDKTLFVHHQFNNIAFNTVVRNVRQRLQFSRLLL